MYFYLFTGLFMIYSFIILPVLLFHYTLALISAESVSKSALKNKKKRDAKKKTTKTSEQGQEQRVSWLCWLGALWGITLW